VVALGFGFSSAISELAAAAGSFNMGGTVSAITGGLSEMFGLVSVITGGPLNGYLPKAEAVKQHEYRVTARKRRAGYLHKQVGDHAAERDKQQSTCCASCSVYIEVAHWLRRQVVKHHTTRHDDHSVEKT
jgi:hypothetical protein